MMNYTYDEAKIMEFGVDRMRLDMGDNEVSGKADTCALGDEEYAAFIEQAKVQGRSWKYAQMLCLEAIAARFAMMTDVQIDGMSADMGSRYERWKIMLGIKRKLFEGISAPLSAPEGNVFGICKGAFDNQRVAQGGAYA